MVHVLHVIARTPVEEVGVRLIGDAVLDVRQMLIVDQLLGHFALDRPDAVHEVTQGLLLDDQFHGRLGLVEQAVDLHGQAVLAGEFLTQLAHGGQGRVLQEAQDVLFLGLVHHLFQTCMPVLARPEDAGRMHLGREVLAVGVQAFPQAEAHQQHQHGKGQGHDQRHGLQVAQAAFAHQHHGHDRHQHAPHDGLPARRAQALVARGDVVEHIDARVGRGDEEERDHGQADDARECRHGQELQELEEQLLGRARHAAQHAGSAVRVHPDGGVAEHGEPQHAEQRRDDQHAEDEFTDGAAARDAGDEQAHERRPRAPPGPVQDGPAGEPLGVLMLVGVGLEAELQDVAGIGADVFAEGGQQVQRGAGGQHEHQQRDGQAQVDLAEQLHALADARDGRGDGQCHDHGDDDDAQGEGVFADPAQLFQTGTHLGGAKAQRGDDAEQRGQQGHDVDGIAQAAVDALLEERIEAGAQRQRQLVAEAEIGQCQGDHAVHAPGVDAPVEHRMQQRLLLTLLGGADRDVGQIVGQWLGHAEEHQAHAHAGRKEHGQPGQHAEFGLFLVIAQLDAAQAADGKDHQKADEDGERQDVEPAEVVEDAGLGGVQQDLGPFGGDEDHGDQRHDEQQRHRNDERIE